MTQDTDSNEGTSRTSSLDGRASIEDQPLSLLKLPTSSDVPLHIRYRPEELLLPRTRVPVQEALNREVTSVSTGGEVGFPKTPHIRFQTATILPRRRVRIEDAWNRPMNGEAHSVSFPAASKRIEADEFVGRVNTFLVAGGNKGLEVDEEAAVRRAANTNLKLQNAKTPGDFKNAEMRGPLNKKPLSNDRAQEIVEAGKLAMGGQELLSSLKQALKKHFIIEGDFASHSNSPQAGRG